MGKTNFDEVQANRFYGPVTGDVTGNVTGGILGGISISKADNYSLSTAEKNSLYIGVTMTAGSKVLTLGLAAGQVAFVRNEGATNAFTVKNVAGDTGTSLAAKKTLLIKASTTANASIVAALD